MLTDTCQQKMKTKHIKTNITKNDEEAACSSRRSLLYFEAVEKGWRKAAASPESSHTEFHESPDSLPNITREPNNFPDASMKL